MTTHVTSRPAPCDKGCGLDKVPVSILLEAEEMFPALEERVNAAQTEVLLSFRIFDPQTRLRSDALREEGLETWQDLIAKTAQRGVSFRVLLTDFEPFLTPDLHQTAWKSVRGFLDAFEGARDSQVLCAQHEAQMSRLAEWLFWPYFLKKLRSISASIKNSERAYCYSPGLFSYLKPDGSINWRACASPASMNPATHHQKLAIIDNAFAIIGGLDVDERRYDNRHHTQAPSETWHDLSVEVTGSSVQSLRDHFVAWWNDDACRTPVRSRLSDFAACSDLDAPQITPMPYKDLGAKPNQGPLCTLVTRSAPRQGLWVLGPEPQQHQILNKKFELIDSAAQFIYMETQFFRHVPLARRLAAAAQRNPALQLVLLLPFAPEEVSFDKQDNPAHRHGEFLQIKCLDIVRHAFGERVGVFGLIKPSKATLVDGRAEAYGSGVVHIHSKVMVADDRWSMVSSANANGRSLLWDTEAGIAIEDADFAVNLRRRLWAAHSGSEAFGDLDCGNALLQWKAIASHNAEAKPHEREGFIAPYLFQPARSFGTRAALVPDNMV